MKQFIIERENKIECQYLNKHISDYNCNFFFTKLNFLKLYNKIIKITSFKKIDFRRK